VSDQPISLKVAHVLAADQVRRHHCHWPGCGKQVPPAMWGCKKHWFTLPQGLRARIWATYRPGQEKDGRPSGAYIDVARQVQAWIAEYVHSESGNP
jgi:hypothetical protein